MSNLGPHLDESVCVCGWVCMSVSTTPRCSLSSFCAGQREEQKDNSYNRKTVIAFQILKRYLNSVIYNMNCGDLQMFHAPKGIIKLCEKNSIHLVGWFFPPGTTFTWSFFSLVVRFQHSLSLDQLGVIGAPST